MTFVGCSIGEQYVNPLFEVFDGGDFVLSSHHDIEEDFTRIRIFLEDPAQADAAAQCLRNALDVVGLSVPVESGEIPDEDWRFAYRRHFQIEAIGRRLLSVPAWETPPESDRIALILDPGMAFGTGKHETTRACLEYIDELSAEGELAQSPRSFLDMGCGSGILSIAAAKLGFSPVCGFDVDEDAVQASRENAAKNGVNIDFRQFALGGGSVTLDASIEAAKGLYPDLALQGRKNGADAPVCGPADLVAANILGPLLIAFAEEISGYCRRHLIVSGILNELYPEVLAAFAPYGFAEASRKTIGEWTTGHLTRKGNF